MTPTPPDAHTFKPDATGTTCERCGGWPNDPSHAPAADAAPLPDADQIARWVKQAEAIDATVHQRYKAQIRELEERLEAATARADAAPLRTLREKIQDAANDLIADAASWREAADSTAGYSATKLIQDALKNEALAAILNDWADELDALLPKETPQTTLREQARLIVEGVEEAHNCGFAYVGDKGYYRWLHKEKLINAIAAALPDPPKETP